jgi:glycolate oxidase
MSADALLRDLAAIVGDRFVLRARAERLAYETDGNPLFVGAPLCTVLPADREQAVAVVRACARHGVPFIPRGAGTGLSGGATPTGGEVVIGMARCRRILHVDPVGRRAVVEPGVVNADLSRHVAPLGLYYAPDPSSQFACTIGGNVAENSGGAHCLKYGVTTNHVLGLEVVLADGRVVELGGGAWDAPGYDLAGLLVGSEGTLGLVTRVTVRLLPQPQAVRTVLALFDEVAGASAAVSAVIAAGLLPAALEMMDRWAIAAVERGTYRVGFPEGLAATLLIEVDGPEAGLDEEQAAILAICRRCGVREVRTPSSPAERTLWWNNRKTAFGAMGKLAPSYYVQDGVIPRSRLTAVLAEVGRIADEFGLLVANVFHAGDGNLHPLLAYDGRRPGEAERVMTAGSEILRVCVAAGGTISGEHGIGLEKREDMRLMFSDADLAMMRAAHDALDPLDLAAPGKVLPLPGRCVEVRRAAWDPRAKLGEDVVVEGGP